MIDTKVQVKFKNDRGTSGRSAPVAIVNLIAAAVAVLITRPTNVTPYLANSVMGLADTVTPANAGSGILKFANVGADGGVVKVVGADLMVHLGAVPGGMAGFTLHLYDAEPDAKLDGATWDLPAADRAKYLGAIAIGTPVDLGSTLFVESSVSKQVKLKEGSSDLYGVLVSVGPYTPASGQVMQVRLQVEGKS